MPEARDFTVCIKYKVPLDLPDVRVDVHVQVVADSVQDFHSD